MVLAEMCICLQTLALWFYAVYGKHDSNPHSTHHHNPELHTILHPQWVSEKDSRQEEELEQSPRDLEWPDVFMALSGVHVKLQQRIEAMCNLILESLEKERGARLACKKLSN